MRRSRTALSLPALAIAVGAVVAGCAVGQARYHPNLPPSASASRGKALIDYYGCGACHVIGGISTANGRVGPPLTDFEHRYTQIAGVMPNTPQNVVRWIMNPQKFVPKVDMPVLGIGKHGAQDIAAYLYGQ